MDDELLGDDGVMEKCEIVFGGGGGGLDVGMLFRKNKKGRLVWVQYNNTRFLHGDTLARRPRRVVCMY